MNDLLTAASADQFPLLPGPSIEDPYLANYVAAMVECAAHRREASAAIDSSSGARV